MTCEKMSKKPQINQISKMEVTHELSDKGKRSYDSKKKQNDNGKVRFRCDFPSTQVKVMLARGWTQVMLLINTK